MTNLDINVLAVTGTGFFLIGLFVFCLYESNKTAGITVPFGVVARRAMVKFLYSILYLIGIGILLYCAYRHGYLFLPIFIAIIIITYSVREYTMSKYTYELDPLPKQRRDK